MAVWRLERAGLVTARVCWLTGPGRAGVIDSVRVAGGAGARTSEVRFHTDGRLLEPSITSLVTCFPVAPEST